MFSYFLSAPQDYSKYSHTASVFNYHTKFRYYFAYASSCLGFHLLKPNIVLHVYIYILYIFISLLYNFSDVLVSEMILGRNICWSLYIFNLIYYFQASVSIRSRYSLYIDDCVSTTKSSNPIRRVMQRNQASTSAMITPFIRSVVAEIV